MTDDNAQTPRPTDDADDPSAGLPLEERFRRLEEQAGFADHRGDQFHEQLVALTSKIESIGRRLSSIESRLTGLAERTDRGFDAVAQRLPTDTNIADDQAGDESSSA